MKRVIASLIVAALAAGAGYVGWTRVHRPTGPERLVVALQPLGRVASSTISAAARAVHGYYGSRVVVLRTVPPPSAAYTRPRNRYKADKLLTFLNGPGYRSYDKVVGITELDISTSKGAISDWGVFGLGSMGGGSCVVSTFRLRRKGNHAKLLERVVKVVIHEVGHTLGLPHCPVPGCVMADARGKLDSVDRESAKLCPACARKVGLQ